MDVSVRYTDEYEEMIQDVEENIQSLLEMYPDRNIELPKLAKKHVSKCDDELADAFDDFAETMSKYAKNNLRNSRVERSDNPYVHPVFSANFHEALDRLDEKGVLEQKGLKVSYNK